jgi:hypothetical protein
MNSLSTWADSNSFSPGECALGTAHYFPVLVEAAR